MLLIGGREIAKVKVVDDDASFRQTLADTVKDASLEPVVASEPLGTLDEFVSSAVASTQAVLCDHHLRQKGVYSHFNGAVAVARLYQQKFPAVLCTGWAKANADEIRGFRRFVPSLIEAEDLNPESVLDGLSACIGEFNGTFRQNREPSRTLVRVEDAETDPGVIYLVVPAFSPRDVIGLREEYVPVQVAEAIRKGKIRLYAFVNLGAERQEELFFERWEVP